MNVNFDEEYRSMRDVINYTDTEGYSYQNNAILGNGEKPAPLNIY